MIPYTEQDTRIFARYFNNVSSFVANVLCGPIPDIDDYILGTEPVQFYEKRFRDQNQLTIDDYKTDFAEFGGLSYEYAVYTRFLTCRPLNMLVVVGGLGAGKTSTVVYLLNLFLEERDTLRTRFPCNCTPCLRQPIHIDCLGIDRSISRDAAIEGVLSRIRFALYNALINEWLLKHGVALTLKDDIPEAFKVLRRLMITNDIARWADPGFPFALQRPEFHLDKPLLEYEATEELVRELVARYASKIDGLAGDLRDITSDSDQSVDFTALISGFYLQLCRSYNPSNLLIVDNLDQLPTGHIESVVQKLHAVASRAKSLPLLVPLRPSSINPKGHVRAVHYMYHYGPHCPTFILHRLQKYVLSRSRNDLVDGDPNGCGVRVFENRPTPEELTAFLITIYMYAKLMTAGLSRTSVPLTNGKHKLPSIHDDHKFLQNMHITPEILTQAAELLQALVGTCGRYATDQLRRFIESVYLEPTILADARKRGLLSGKEGQLRISFGRLISAMVAPRRGQHDVGTLANIYAPSRRGPNRTLPTLAKLRILKLLAGSEMTVGELVTQLGTYGIPSEVTIDSLNDLHNKTRLLIWFSTNSDLCSDGSDDLEQYVSISEHGLGYLRNLVGDFEYMWYCALGIPEHDRPHEASNFHTRLKHFTRLVKAVGETEWKQRMFRRCLASTVMPEDVVYRMDECFTLWLLYSSLERVIASSRFALSLQADPRSDYAKQTETLIQELCAVILNWQERYRLCYADEDIIDAYDDPISKARAPLEHFCGRDSLGANCREAVRAVLESWKRNPAKDSARPLLDESIPPKDDFVTKSIQYTRGLVPGLREYMQHLDKVEAARMYFWQYVRGREKLARLLEGRLPAYTQVLRYLEYLVTDADLVVRSSAEIAAASTVTLEWFLQERRILEEDCRILRDNIMSGGPWAIKDMDKKKQRCNNIMAVMERTARRFLAKPTDHLSPRWAATGVS